MSKHNLPVTPTKAEAARSNVVLKQPFRSPLKRTAESNDLSPSKRSVDDYQSSSPVKRSVDIFSSPATDTFTSPPELSAKFREKFLVRVHERVTIDPILVKQESALDLSLRQMRQKLLQCQLAHKYETATTKLADGTEVLVDDNLACLIDKWRTAAQNASKYLFTLAQERVARMGGVSEFKRRTQPRRFDDDDEKLGEDEIARLRDEYDYDVEMRAAVNETPNEAEEEFSIEMMLTALNVDAAVVFPT